MPLGKVQKTFRDTMLTPANSLEETDAGFLGLFDNSGAPVKERLKIYHNNVVGSLTEALRATFPITEQLVGTDFFKSMARAFIFKHPPREACLLRYGIGFDTFIASYEPVRALPYLPDIAQLEIAQNNAYYATDDTPLTGADLQEIPAEQLAEIHLNLRYSASLIRSRYPVLDIRDFCNDENNTPPPDLSQEHNTKLLIYRPNLDVCIAPLSDDEFFLLKKLNEGQPLGRAVEQAIEIYKNFNFTHFLEKHISLETFRSL
ncbi:MAG: HvfC/BufC family peptide modification chaperone [Alcanivorax sp.]